MSHFEPVDTLPEWRKCIEFTPSPLGGFVVAGEFVLPSRGLRFIHRILSAHPRLISPIELDGSLDDDPVRVADRVRKAIANAYASLHEGIEQTGLDHDDMRETLAHLESFVSFNRRLRMWEYAGERRLKLGN